MMSRRGLRLRIIGVLAIPAVLLTSCSYLYPGAIVLRNDVPVLSYKRCSDTEGVGSVIIRRGIPGDKRTPMVWTAKRQPGAAPLFELPLQTEIPGYDILRRGTLDPELYYFVDAVDTEGYELGGPDFRLKDLRSGRALISSDPELGRDYESLSKWENSRADCPENAAANTGRFAVILVAIFFTGLVFSAIVLYQDRRRRRALAQS